MSVSVLLDGDNTSLMHSRSTMRQKERYFDSEPGPLS